MALRRLAGGDRVETLRRLAVIAAIAAAWAGSLALPAVDVQGGPTLGGLDLLLRGWEGMTRGVPAWLANPLFVAAVVAALLGRDALALVLSAAALALGVTSFGAEEVLRRRVESVPELELLSGFYLWMLALLALCLQSLTHVLLSHSRSKGSRTRP